MAGTAVAGLLASTLAARREHRVLAVNASAGNRSALWHAGCTVAAGTTPERDATRRAARSGEEVTAGLAGGADDEGGFGGHGEEDEGKVQDTDSALVMVSP